ncbi:MAG: thioredoxin-dependent thiol peroxidase [Minisyncoccia bacterium]
MKEFENKKAPVFNLPDQHGNKRHITEFAGKKTLLYFYPKDMTPGCTTETVGFQNMKKDFENENTVIIGLSKDSIERHQKFCEKHDLDIILLSDTEGKVLEKYAVWTEKSMFGKKYMGISRESFLINETGRVIKHWKKVKPVSHPQEVLDYIKNQD